ncbi:MAG: hypothetical protein QF436_03105 [Candidatus Woesearchaeota archaeon]|jgi:hypothetical protein|nr:hypothetical protein [Candidatus Woesearchaeota archaeon]MDP7623077.1 hypothetical protein [Candidatus Woesearchaeota archaeon]HJN56348.1 hypothetical protein [Candidatus Woesearchaeota archaeon]|tara:strand:+ start:684 stop:1163 length:480 start_codon:yes stop_codon:yes gene_type:complete
MKIPRYKKGAMVMTEWPFWMMFIVAVGITTVVVVYIGNFFVTEAAEIPAKVEEELIILPRFFNLPECFAYEGNSSVRTGIIDLSKFKQETFEDGRCFPRSKVKYGYSLSLEIPGRKLGPIKTFNWAEGFAGREIIKDITVMDNDIEYNGKLMIGIKNVE